MFKAKVISEELNAKASELDPKERVADHAEDSNEVKMYSDEAECSKAKLYPNEAIHSQALYSKAVYSSQIHTYKVFPESQEDTFSPLYPYSSQTALVHLVRQMSHTSLLQQFKSMLEEQFGDDIDDALEELEIRYIKEHTVLHRAKRAVKRFCRTFLPFSTTHPLN